MSYPSKIESLVDVTSGQTLAAGGHAARHNDVNAALVELADVLTVPAVDTLAFVPNGVTERMRITSAGNVGIGTSSPSARLDVNGSMNLNGSIEASTSSAFAPQVNLTNTTNDGNATFVQLSKSRSGGLVNSGDNLGTVQWRGHDGSQMRNAAAIVCFVDAAPGASDMPGRLSFQTSADGGFALSERMRIDNAGLITGTGTSLGAWTAYTPTLGGTGWAIGNGTVVGAYCQIGKVVAFYARFILGSTSTAGGSALTISLPVTANGTQMNGGLTVMTTDASAASRYLGSVEWINTTSIGPRSIGTGGVIAGFTTTAPFTWATSDQIEITGTYQAA
jgi:hypothetical protein